MQISDKSQRKKSKEVDKSIAKAMKTKALFQKVTSACTSLLTSISHDEAFRWARDTSMTKALQEHMSAIEKTISSFMQNFLLHDVKDLRAMYDEDTMLVETATIVKEFHDPLVALERLQKKVMSMQKIEMAYKS